MVDISWPDDICRFFFSWTEATFLVVDFRDISIENKGISYELLQLNKLECKLVSDADISFSHTGYWAIRDFLGVWHSGNICIITGLLLRARN